MKKKVEVQESFTAVLRMLWTALGKPPAQHDGMPTLVQEALVRPPPAYN